MKSTVIMDVIHISSFGKLSYVHVTIDTFSQFTQGSPGGSVGKESACRAGDLGSITGSGRSPGEGNSNPLQYSCLENPMGWGAWQATVHGVTKSQTWLSNFTQFIWATAHSSETTKHIQRHLYACFAVIKLPKTIKTNNGPAYTSRAFQQFLKIWSIKHSTGIPQTSTAAMENSVEIS